MALAKSSSGKKTSRDKKKSDDLKHEKVILPGSLGPSGMEAPRCCQCGRRLPGMPFPLANILCRDCYGSDRYATIPLGHWSPEKPLEITVTDEESHAKEKEAVWSVTVFTAAISRATPQGCIFLPQHSHCSTLCMATLRN